MNDLKFYDLPACPVATTALLIGDHWKILITRELDADGKRFGELKKGLPGISNKVLSQHIKMMEQRELVERFTKDDKVLYRLTKIGLELKPVMSAMWEFGEKYQEYVSDEKEAKN